MDKNVILRPVFNRPEMLQLSIEYEMAARTHAGLDKNAYLTVFLVEYGALKHTRQLVKSYPFPSVALHRKRHYENLNYPDAFFNAKKYFRYGLSRNLMEGMKFAFEKSDDHILIIEDDILIHKTYFNYMQTLFRLQTGRAFTSISASKNGMYAWLVKSATTDNSGDVSLIRKGHDYSPWGPAISKWFFDDYVREYANEAYYNNQKDFMNRLDQKYASYIQKGYKYQEPKHLEQAGMINRLVDVAMIEKQAYVLTPDIDRQMHIGFYGANRGRNRLKGFTFKQRVESLRAIIDQQRMYDVAKRKHHKDYRYFNEALNTWDGQLTIVDE